MGDSSKQGPLKRKKRVLFFFTPLDGGSSPPKAQHPPLDLTVRPGCLKIQSHTQLPTQVPVTSCADAGLRFGLKLVHATLTLRVTCKQRNHSTVALGPQITKVVLSRR